MMKILFATLVFHVILCQVRAGSRRTAVMAQPQNGLMSDDADLPRVDFNPDYNMLRYQSNVITGRLSIHVEEMMSYIIEKLQTLKDVFDRLGWTTLAEYLTKLMGYLSQYENKVQADNRSYGRRFFGKALPRHPCKSYDTST